MNLSNNFTIHTYLVSPILYFPVYYYYDYDYYLLHIYKHILLKNDLNKKKILISYVNVSGIVCLCFSIELLYLFSKNRLSMVSYSCREPVHTCYLSFKMQLKVKKIKKSRNKYH